MQTQSLINYLLMPMPKNWHLYDYLEQYAVINEMYVDDGSSDLKIEKHFEQGGTFDQLSEHDQLFAKLLDLHFITWDQGDPTGHSNLCPSLPDGPRDNDPDDQYTLGPGDGIINSIINPKK